MKVYMDEFIVHGETFEEELRKLEKVLIHCKKNNLSLSNEIYFMLMIEGIVLGHHISSKGICVDPKKIKIIK